MYLDKYKFISWTTDNISTALLFYSLTFDEKKRSFFFAIATTYI